jgi:hypothetical protein
MVIGKIDVDGTPIPEFLGVALLYYGIRHLRDDESFSRQSFNPCRISVEEFLMLDALSDVELEKIPLIGPKRREKLRRSAIAVRDHMNKSNG